MKKWRKNLVAAGILVTVCCGIYINWLYSGGEAKNLEDTLASDKVMSDTLLDLGDDVPVGGTQGDNNTQMDYFAAVRLSRQEARDNAVTLLQEAMAYGDAESVAGANAALEQIVKTALTEAQIESLVIAKGYTDCVAYMNEQGISVAVASPEGGLQASDVAVIADIVLAQSEYSMADIRVVEVQ